MADVYDEWYADLDPTAAVERLAALADGGRVLELGVGTGRLALPLAARGLEVHGVDASDAMLARLRAKPGAHRVRTTTADMAGPEPAGPFALVFAAANTFFSLGSEHTQQRCLTNAAARLEPGGAVALEAVVPDDRIPQRDSVEVRRIEVDRVVLFVNRIEPESQEAFGQHIDITEQGIRLRPSHIRYATPDQVDAMAAGAGLRLADRWADWSGTPFSAESPAHVSVYRRSGVPVRAGGGGGSTEP